MAVEPPCPRINNHACTIPVTVTFVKIKRVPGPIFRGIFAPFFFAQKPVPPEGASLPDVLDVSL